MPVSERQSLAAIHRTIERYYTARVSKFGPTPLGVDWTCTAAQELRFVQLLKICRFRSPFSLNDIGCGYGALLAFLSKRYPNAKIDYLGIDLSAAMISRARRRYARHNRVKFKVGNTPPRIADYCVASGIFNVKLTHDVRSWERFIAHTLRVLTSRSRYGLAVNFMLPAKERRSTDDMLYRTSPSCWLEFCRSEFDCSSEVIADYGLREFTLLLKPRVSVDENGLDRALKSMGSKSKAPVVRNRSSARR